MAMGKHHSSNMMKDEWLTPPWILLHLGKFDLDPCAPKERPWNTAKYHVHKPDFPGDADGLETAWHGRVWLNPPYGRETGRWLNKLANHGNGIALIFARTETEMFFEHVWNKADAVLFIRRRLHFHHVDGSEAKENAGAPSVLVAYGKDNARRLRDSGIAGKFLHFL